MLFLDEVVNGFTCGGADVLKIIKFVSILLDIVLFIIPMALIVMVSVDFAKNVIAGKDDEMKKNVNLAIKRIMFCAALFLVNPIVSFVITFIGENSENYLKCIEIAESYEVWKYKIDWDYYPYDVDSAIEGEENGSKYVIYEYTKEDGTTGKIKIYENGTVKEQ